MSFKVRAVTKVFLSMYLCNLNIHAPIIVLLIYLSATEEDEFCRDGTLNYKLVQMAFSMFEKAWIDRPLHG